MKKSDFILMFILTSNIFARNNLWTIRQIDNTIPFYSNKNCQLCKYTYVGFYRLDWTSSLSHYQDLVIGDADQDGENELVAIDLQHLYIYDSNLDNPLEQPLPPYEEFLPPQDYQISNLVIADADNDGKNEILFRTVRKDLIIYRYENHELILEHNIDCNKLSYSLEAGDADNDGKNELLMGRINYIDVWRYDSNLETYVQTELISSEGMNDSPIIADVDNDGQNEIICGGSFSTVRIWRYNGSAYVKLGERSVSHFSQGVRVGDVDGDGRNELIVGTATGEFARTPFLYIFKYDNNTFREEWRSINILSGVGMNGIEIGDADNDGINEFMAFVAQWEGLVVHKLSVGSEITQPNFDVVFYDSTGRIAITGEYNGSLEWEPVYKLENHELIADADDYRLVVHLKNVGKRAESVEVFLNSENPAVAWIKQSSNYGSMDYGELKDNHVDPFRFILTETPSDPIDILVSIGSEAGVFDTLRLDFVPASVQGSYAESFHLEQNFSNPFNPSSEIRYTVHENVDVLLQVFNLNGQLVTTLVDERKETGAHQVRWQGLNQLGQPVSGGLYLYRMTVTTANGKSHSLIRKMMKLN